MYVNYITVSVCSQNIVLMKILGDHKIYQPNINIDSFVVWHMLFRYVVHNFLIKLMPS